MIENQLLTKSGVAYDLNISPHEKEIHYNEEDSVVYVFSSNLYKRKFEEKLEDNRRKINESLTKRFGIQIKNDLLCDLKLYSSIEKRGFLLKNKDEGIKCLNDLILDGQRVIIKN